MNQKTDRRDAPSRASLYATQAFRMMTRRPFLKLGALLLAVLLWSVLIASDGTLTREKVFTGAELTVTGQDALKARGLIVTEGLEDLEGVRIRAEVMQSVYDSVTAAHYGPRIDLSKIREAGEQTVQIGMTSTSFGPVLETDPASVTLVVEEYAISGRIPVMVEVSGELSDGLWADTPRADPSLVSVSGPKSMVQQVARVAARLDQSMLTEDRVTQRGARPFVLQDESGAQLNSPLLQVSSNDGVILESLLVDVYCYPLKQAPVELSGAVTGEPAEGYVVASVTADPERVEIAAQPAALEEIYRVLTDAPLKIDGANRTVRDVVRIKRPGDVKYINREEIMLTVRIEEKRIERVLRNLPVEVVGLGDGVSAKLSRSKMNATISGGYSWLQGLQSDEVHLYVDAADLPAGAHDVEVRAQIDGVAMPDCSPEIAMLRVTLSEKGS